MAPTLKRAKTQRGKRFLEQRQSKVVENDKQALIARGGKCSELVSKALSDLYALKKPLAQQLKRKNPFHLFDDETGLLKVAERLDTSLFVFGTHSKKHPHSLIFGRLFDYQLLDMVELVMTKFTPMSNFQSGGVTFGCKPVVQLQGPLFSDDHDMKRIGNLMLLKVDWFRGPVVESIRLQGLEMVISLTATSEKEILFRVYKTKLLKASDSKTTPMVELIEMGPSIDFTVGRHKLATDDYFKSAIQKPKELKVKPKNKNVSHDVFGTKVARIHVGRQKLDEIPTRRVRALKRGAVGKKPRRELNE